jgi:PhnB protein
MPVLRLHPALLWVVTFEVEGQRAVPMLSYEDVAEAVDWLTSAFGFREEGRRFTDEDGRVTHAELELDGATVMLGWPGEAYQAPRHHADVCTYAAAWLDVPWVVDGVFVTVADLDAHHATAVEAGAVILRGPEDDPVGRLYTAEDPEGHRWMFMQRSGNAA